MKASSNRPVSAPVPETAPHVGARFIAPWAADNPPSSPIAASFAARKPRAAARLADPFANPATQKIWAEEHALAFTVAGMARDDILAALRDGLSEVIAGKLSREEWLEGARARLIKAGYWREEGEKGGITPSRLQLIFDTNTANAYHGGRWQRLEERRETHPYLMYLTKRDHRVRPEHRAWEGLILPIDHPFWQTHFPPNGFRCRCAVLGVTQAEYDQLKRDGGQFAGGTVKFDNDIDADLEALDPGFAYNPGIPGSRAAALQRLAEEKAARAEQRAARRAAAAQARAAKKAAKDAQRAASAEAEAKARAETQAIPAREEREAQAPDLDSLPAEISRDTIREMVQSDAFARWYENPSDGVLWPIARIPEEDARALGLKSGVNVAMMSEWTARKQAAHHPDMSPTDYARAQDVVDNHTNKAQDGLSMIYVQEVDGEDDGGLVLVVKATKTGEGLFFTSSRKLSRKQAERESEIRRLLRKEKKNGAAPVQPRVSGAAGSPDRS